jgi:NADH-quinone oxidoreductase subunit G
MPKLTVDGVEVEVENGLTVLQACEQAGVEVPRFCYHERLSIAGNCRMCLVEVKPGPPKPQASCALPAGEGMEVITNSPMVQKARHGVMEFLLINHPLDCPICDQGGECDLQDQAMGYGHAGSRYTEDKRAVSEKYMGPLINTIMTRCIHCTRCVRFSTEVGGVTDMGMVNRGESAEITTLEKAVSSELSGNVIDLCPVGALTSKPYAFAARAWELKKTETIDVMDAVGSNIRVDARGNEVMRVLPRLNEDVNEEWISDKSRFACDGLRRQRLDKPYIRDSEGKLKPASWDEAFALIAKKADGIAGDRIAAIAGDMCDVESMFALKALMDSLGSQNLDCRQDSAAVNSDARAGYLFNTGIANTEDADVCLLIGTNPRIEAPLVNSRLRKGWLAGGLRIGVVGPKTDLTYDYDHLGAGPQTLQEIADGTHPFAEVLESATRPMLIIGMGALTRDDGAAVLAAGRAIADKYGLVSEDWNGFNVLNTAAARVGALDIGFTPGSSGRDVEGVLNGADSGDIEMVYLLGADELDVNRLKNAFVVYQGHHGDAGAHAADVILPGAAYTEKDGIYVNLEGRVQMGRRAVFPPGDAKEDWSIVRALSEKLGKTLPFDSLAALRQKIHTEHSHFTQVDSCAPTSWEAFGTPGEMTAAPFSASVENFYMTDPISRASETMAACTREFTEGGEEATGTNG